LLEAREWNEAKSILLELIGAVDVRHDGNLGLVHTLAELYMAERDLRKAADYCFQAAKGEARSERDMSSSYTPLLY
jgi:hypothetical protein